MKKGIFIFVVCFISLLTCFTAYARPEELEIGCGTTTITLEGNREVQRIFMILKDGALIFNVKPMVESCGIAFYKYDEEGRYYSRVKVIRFEESNNVISELVNLDKGTYIARFNS